MNPTRASMPASREFPTASMAASAPIDAAPLPGNCVMTKRQISLPISLSLSPFRSLSPSLLRPSLLFVLPWLARATVK